MKSFTSTNSNDVFFFGFSPPDLTWSETAWNWLFQPLVAVLFQAPCRGLVHGGVHASHLPHHLEEFPRSASGWTASASTQEVQDGGDSLFLNTTQTTSDRRVDQECVLLCNQPKCCTWYQMVWHGSYEFIFIHCMPCSFASLLMNCKKKCYIINQTCKKRQCFDQFMPKEIHSTDSQAPFPPGCRQWRWWPPALSVRAPSRVRKPRVFFVFSDPMIFFWAGRSPNLRSVFTFHECHESRY